MSDLDLIEKSVQSLVHKSKSFSIGGEPKGMSKRKMKTPAQPSVSGSIIDLEATLARLEKGLATEEDLKACQKIIERYRNNNALRGLPSPVDGVEIPDKIEDRKALYRYALQFPSYVRMYEDLKNDDYTEKDRRNDLLAGLSYLHNAKNFDLQDSETPSDFYLRCQDHIDETIVELEDVCREKGTTIETYFNEYSF